MIDLLVHIETAAKFVSVNGPKDTRLECRNAGSVNAVWLGFAFAVNDETFY